MANALVEDAVGVAPTPLKELPHLLAAGYENGYGKTFAAPVDVDAAARLLS